MYVSLIQNKPDLHIIPLHIQTNWDIMKLCVLRQFMKRSLHSFVSLWGKLSATFSQNPTDVFSVLLTVRFSFTSSSGVHFWFGFSSASRAGWTQDLTQVAVVLQEAPLLVGLFFVRVFTLTRKHKGFDTKCILRFSRSLLTSSTCGSSALSEWYALTSGLATVGFTNV